MGERRLKLVESEKKLFTETEKIRHYVMNLIYRNGSRSVRILSSRELAEQFQVTRFTVREALESLTREKYLITQKGIGPFTNPLAGFRFPKKTPPPLVGLKFGPGDLFYYDAPAMRTLAEIMLVLSTKNFNIHFLSGGGATADKVRYELDCTYVDAVLGVNCRPVVLEEAAERMPAVGIGCRGGNATSIEYDVKAAVAELIGNLSRPVIFWDAQLHTAPHFREALKNEKSIELKEVEIAALSAETELPGAIVSHVTEHEFLQTLEGGKDSAADCKLVFLAESSLKSPYWLLDAPHSTAAETAAAELARLLGGDRETRRIYLDYRLRPMNR